MDIEQIISLLVALGAGGAASKAVTYWRDKRKERRDGDVAITLSEREELKEIHRTERQELKDLREMTMTTMRKLEVNDVKKDYEIARLKEVIEGRDKMLATKDRIIDNLRKQIEELNPQK